MHQHDKVLVLNTDFTPLGVISWRRAITLSFIHDQDNTKGVSVVDYYPNDYIITQYQKYPVPAVVRSMVYVKQKKNSIPFSKKNVFLRDKCVCQYCGNRYSVDKLEYDHVIPKSKWDKKWGTATQWTNIVCCCQSCNRRKNDRTPTQAGMKLLREPKLPNPHGYVLGISFRTIIPEQWMCYLPQFYKEMCKTTNNGV